MDQHVIAPLQKGGVHRKHWDHPLLGKPRRHGDAVALGNAHVKKAVWKLLCKAGQAGAVRHGGGNGADAAILRRHGGEGISKNRRKALAPALFHNSRLGVKGGHAVKPAGLPLGKRIPLALYRVYMDQHRPLLLSGPLQHVAQPVQVVAVNRAQIGKAHVLKQGAAGPENPL